jgi:hypothetical protein
VDQWFEARNQIEKTKMKNNVIHGRRSRFARIAIPALALASAGIARADDVTTPVQTAISGLSTPMTALIGTALAVGMLIVGGFLAFKVGKKFLS